MNTPSTPSHGSSLTDILELRASGIFPQGKEPSTPPLCNWTKLRRISHHRVGHLAYYDVAKVAVHIRIKLKMPARG